MTVSRTSPRLQAQSRVQESVLATTTFNILPGTQATALLGGDPAGSADSPTFTPEPATGNAAPTDAPLPIATLDPTTAAPTEPGTTPAPDGTTNPAVDPTAGPTVNATPKPDPTAKPPSTPKPDPTPADTPDPTPKPTPKPTPTPGGGIPATPAGDLLRKDFSDGSLWPFRVVDYPNDHPDDAMSYACDYEHRRQRRLGPRWVPRPAGVPEESAGAGTAASCPPAWTADGNSASFSFTHGYLQFAARMNVGHATWQAPMWLLNTVTGWHPAEIDVAEVISGRLTYNLHGTVNKQVASTAPGNIGSTWHVFGVAKTSTHITFTMDGNVVGRWNGNMPDPMALLADSKVGFKWDGVYPNGSTPDPTWVKLAWVTVSSKIPAGL